MNDPTTRGRRSRIRGAPATALCPTVNGVDQTARIYRYVVRYDSGTAPRPFDGICSLAVCKPSIRARAQVGDWIVGFRSRHPGDVVYAMQVTERITLGQYWHDPRFANRRPRATPYPDNFYRPREDGKLEQVPNPVHGPANSAKDCSGLHVLLSDRFWYFGRDSVPLPNHLLHLVQTTQGHAVHVNRRPGDVAELRAWLANWPAGRLGVPIDDRGARIARDPKRTGIDDEPVVEARGAGKRVRRPTVRSCGT